MEQTSHLYPGAAWNIANAKEIRRALIDANFAVTNSDSESFLRHVKMACILATDYFRHPLLTPEQQAQVQAVLRLNVKHPTPRQLGMLTSILWALAKNVIAG